MSGRPHPHPHIVISSGSTPTDASSWSPSPYIRRVPTSPSIWADSRSSIYSNVTSSTSQHLHAPPIAISRPSSYHEPDPNLLAFPEPQLYRSPSQSTYNRPNPTPSYRATRSDLSVSPVHHHHPGESRPPSLSGDSSPELSANELSEELSSLTLESEDGIRRFQANELPENDQEWYRLVPAAARDVLDKEEVQRQSVIFEIIKSERDYVNDMLLIQEVFIEPMENTLPVPQNRIQGFLDEVFCNIDRIREHHQQMLGALFGRQREQHPLISSVADIVLETSLLFRDDYEVYIKHYPLAVACHNSEYKRNQKYQIFLQQCYLDPRLAKRDLSAILSRPVTRLPRLALLFENLQKHTAPDHEDMGSIPLILELLKSFVQSTQPGIAAAQDKVKLWQLCESLMYQRGEIIDLDLFDESRSLVHSGPLARRWRSPEFGYTWADLHVALLDNYLLLLKPDKQAKLLIVSRPIPLEYLRLGTFSDPPDNRKEKTDDGGILDSFLARQIPYYPFTVYHASAKKERRYTLYAKDEAGRQKWQNMLLEALGIRKVRQEGNMWFAPEVIHEGFFRHDESTIHFSNHLTGRVNGVAPLVNNGKHLIAVGCSVGLFVSIRGHNDFRQVLDTPNVTSIAALPEFNKILVLSDKGLLSYSLDLLCRAGLGTSSLEHLEASMEHVAGQDISIVSFRAGRVGDRTMVLFTAKRLLQFSFHAVEILHPADGLLSMRRSFSGQVRNMSFRPFGDPLTIPKEAQNFTVWRRHVGICVDKRILLIDPTNPNVSSSTPTTIPKFSGIENNPAMANLKNRCQAHRPLGLVRCPGNQTDQYLVIYDELGCYIDKHGVPCRSSGYLRWETPATSFIPYGDHILLISPEFIEIRTILTGKLVQVIEGADVRLVYPGLLPEDSTVLVAMHGEERQGVMTDKIVELLETSELETPRTAIPDSAWDEWDA